MAARLKEGVSSSIKQVSAKDLRRIVEACKRPPNPTAALKTLMSGKYEVVKR
jgi:hypothetical protein